MDDSTRISNVLKELRDLGFAAEADAVQLKATNRVYVGDLFKHVRSGATYTVRRVAMDGVFASPVREEK